MLTQLIFYLLHVHRSKSFFFVHSGAQYLDVIVDASRQDLITGVIEGHGQNLVGVLESVDGPLLANVPQLQCRQAHNRETLHQKQKHGLNRIYPTKTWFTRQHLKPDLHVADIGGHRKMARSRDMAKLGKKEKLDTSHR